MRRSGPLLGSGTLSGATAIGHGARESSERVTRPLVSRPTVEIAGEADKRLRDPRRRHDLLARLDARGHELPRALKPGQRRICAAVVVGRGQRAWPQGDRLVAVGARQYERLVQDPGQQRGQADRVGAVEAAVAGDDRMLGHAVASARRLTSSSIRRCVGWRDAA